MESLKIAINNISKISDDSWNELISYCSVKQYTKNEFVLAQGAVCNSMYFVNKGLLRIYYIKEKKEISEWFAFDETFCFSIISYFQKVPSYLAIQCLEDSEVISISRDGLLKLKNQNFEISNLAFSMISHSLILSQQRMYSIQFETAIQRYETLIKDYPNIVQRVPLLYIASYLGVTAETLSRIRTQIH